MLLIAALVLLGLTGSALADGGSVIIDAQDGKIDECYSRAEFRDALATARDDQRLYANSIDVIKEGEYSNVTVPGQPCGSGRVAPARAVPLSSSGAKTLWGALVLIVIVASGGTGVLVRRRAR